MKYSKSRLTPAKKKFAQVYAMTDNASEAVRQAYPGLVKSSTPNYIKEKGKRMVTNGYVLQEVSRQKKKLEALSDKAIERLEAIIDRGSERNAMQASMYVYNHAHGRAKQKIEHQSSVLKINLDLSGEDGPTPVNDAL